MLRRVRARLTVVLISGVMVAGLALAGAALGAHSMTSPTAVGLFKAKNQSGFVAFTWNEYGGFHGTKRYTVQTITDFRFHDGCTKSMTKIKKTIRIRHNRFSYHADGLRITGKGNLSKGGPSVIKGTVKLADPDCAADSNGVITFRATYRADDGHVPGVRV
jgi:hypothetical protein